MGNAYSSATSSADFPASRTRDSSAAGSSTASFLRLSSIEITPKQVEKLPILKEKMVPGCRVFVALIDAGDLGGQIEAVKQLKAAGFQPVPHVPARFVKDEADLRARIKALAEAGSDTMLVLGGGAPEPIGQYDSAIQLMQTGVFQANGVKSLGIAGHPEGNPDITKVHGEAVLLKALKDTGLKATVPVNAVALDRYRPLIEAALEQGHEIAAHGWSTDAIHHSGLTEDEERTLVTRTREAFDAAGLTPRAWMSPARLAPSTPIGSVHTTRLVTSEYRRPLSAARLSGKKK
jgi:hypothetical protein